MAAKNIDEIALQSFADYSSLVSIVKTRKQIPADNPQIAEQITRLKEALTSDPSAIERISSYLAILSRMEEEDSILSLSAIALSLNQDSPELNLYLGRAFLRNHHFLPANLLFSNGLKTTNSPEKTYLHLKFHTELGNSILRMHDFFSYEIPITEVGFKPKELEFEIRESGLYLPNLGFNLPNAEYLSLPRELGERKGSRVARERYLAHIHHALDRAEKIRNKPHLADNCPYIILKRHN